MAISNLLSLNPTLKPQQSSFGVKTTTPSGVPSPLTFNSSPTTQPTSGLLATSAPTTTATNQNLLSTTPPAVTQSLVQPPTQTQAPAAPVNGLFQNVVTSLANRGTNPNTTAQGYTKQAADYGAGAIPIAAQARDIAAQFGQQYADVGQKGAAFRAGQLTTGTTPVAEGNAAVTAQTQAAQQTALAQGEQAALQGVGYELTGQQQAQQAANAAAGQEYTGQGLAQGALGSAAGYAQPAQNFPFVFDPITKSFSAPGVGGAAGGTAPGISYNPTTDAQTFAQSVINHKMSYQDALSALGYAGPTATALLSKAITDAGGNITELQAQTGVQGAQEQQAQAYQSALNQGKALQSQLSDLITAFQLNPNDLNAANIGLQAIAKNTSDYRYKALQNYVNDIANTYAQILTPAGGSPTDYKTGLAQSMLDATASGQSIQTTMQILDQQALAKIQNVRTITPTSGTSNNSFGGGGTVQTSVGAISTDW